VVCNKERKTGKAPPKRLTSHQRQIVEKLIAAHAEDVPVSWPACELWLQYGCIAVVALWLSQQQRMERMCR
jgi:hypothetical protein